jgi:choloylglycine hydrolase
MTKTSFGRKMTAMIAACGLLMAIPADLAQACTGIRLIAADGSVVHARTLEFAIDIHSNVLVIPRGYERTATAPDDKAGLKWKAKYASVGASALGLPILVDGLNEAGLAVGLFYFPTTAGYMPYSPGDAGKAIAPWELGSWLLDNFASVDEVKANIGAIVVPATVFKGWGLLRRSTPSCTTLRARASSSNMSEESSTSTTARSASSPIRRASTGR